MKREKELPEIFLKRWGMHFISRRIGVVEHFSSRRPLKSARPSFGKIVEMPIKDPIYQEYLSSQDPLNRHLQANENRLVPLLGGMCVSKLEYVIHMLDHI